MITRSEGFDLIDLYGGDEDRWPEHSRDDLFDLMARDKDFRKHVEAVRSLDTSLENWEYDENEGVGIDEEFDEEDGDEPNEDGEDEVERDASGDEPSDDQTAEDEEGDEDDSGFGAPGEPDMEMEGEDADLDDLPFTPPSCDFTPPEDSEDYMPQVGDEDGGAEEEAEPFDMDMGGVKDMDELLAQSIEAEMHGAFDRRVQQCLTRDFDIVKPLDAPATQSITKMEDAVRSVTGVLQKELQRIIVARSQSYFVPGFRSGRLNGPSLHRLMANDDRVFRRKHVAETQKVAVTLLVDNSGSMGGAKMTVAMQSAWAFADTLEKLKIPCEVLGFTTTHLRGRDQYDELEKRLPEFMAATGLPYGVVRKTPLYMPIFKSYDEKFGQEQRRRMAYAVSTQDYLNENNDAIAIKYAMERLRVRQEPRKILIVFSDGQPADPGTDWNVLLHSTEEAVKACEKSGIETIGVGIMSNAVKSFYPKHHVIQNVSDLPSFVMHELKALLVGGRLRAA